MKHPALEIIRKQLQVLTREVQAARVPRQEFQAEAMPDQALARVAAAREVVQQAKQVEADLLKVARPKVLRKEKEVAELQEMPQARQAEIYLQGPQNLHKEMVAAENPRAPEEIPAKRGVWPPLLEPEKTMADPLTLVQRVKPVQPAVQAQERVARAKLDREV